MTDQRVIDHRATLPLTTITLSLTPGEVATLIAALEVLDVGEHMREHHIRPIIRQLAGVHEYTYPEHVEGEQ